MTVQKVAENTQCGLRRAMGENRKIINSPDTHALILGGATREGVVRRFLWLPKIK